MRIVIRGTYLIFGLLCTIKNYNLRFTIHILGKGQSPTFLEIDKETKGPISCFYGLISTALLIHKTMGKQVIL